MTSTSAALGQARLALGIEGAASGGIAESLAAELGVSRCARLRQVHGTVVRAAGSAPSPELATGDGLVSDVPGTAVAVVTADCVPLLLSAGQGRAVAAVHAGWRGAAAGIVPEAHRALVELAGASRDVHAFLGPAAGGCCYEVGDEVVAALERAAPGGAGDAWVRPGRGVRAHVDLRAFVLRQLVDLGVEAGRIFVRPECTICDPRWPSYRREGKGAGRIWSAVAPAGRA